MHPILLYLLVCLGSGVMGMISCAFLYTVNWLLTPRTGTSIETTFLIAGLLGVGLIATGRILDIPALAAAGGLLCSWIVLPVLVIPPLLIWQFIAWCRGVDL